MEYERVQIPRVNVYIAAVVYHVNALNIANHWLGRMHPEALLPLL